ncbi:hypothetical protein niasHT_021140 [Heterodera trifolii]|uniref:BLOC-1-related complex subunit 5 n=1 Tax=Heterodera trifolii TaxID=157864 RepID=A0ABD2JEX9_9BILA
MGNEHSGGRFGGNGTNKERAEDDGGQTSPSPSTGIPASFSFLAKKRNSTKSALMGSIVVVNEGASCSSFADPGKDADLRRIKEIPRFLPLLRGVLPGHRDIPEVQQKIDSKSILSFMHRLQQHFKSCAQTVATEQGRMFARIVEIDQLISSLLKKTSTATKRLDALNNELRRVGTFSSQLEEIQASLLDLSSSANSLNQLLSFDDRLPPLQFAFTPILTRKKLSESAGTMLLQNSDNNNSGDRTAIERDLRKVSELRVVDRK